MRCFLFAWGYGLMAQQQRLALRCALVNDLPAVVALHPVLAFLHAVGQVAAGVILLEVDHRQIGLAWVGKYTDVGKIYFDP